MEGRPVYDTLWQLFKGRLISRLQDAQVTCCLAKEDIRFHQGHWDALNQLMGDLMAIEECAEQPDGLKLLREEWYGGDDTEPTH
jgi:hypothetical protein